jgi:hypothetical protein
MRLPCLLVPILVGALGFSPDPYRPHAAQPQAADNHLLGTWRLNLARSTYSPGPPPVSETRTFERDREGVKGTVYRRLQDGRTETIEYRADYNREYPVSGADAFDAVIFKRVDMYISEAVLSHAGRVYGTARRVISRDATTMTITFRRETETGGRVINVAVYEKVAP